MSFSQHLCQSERELSPYYIPATPADLASMLKAVGAKRLDDLFAHIDGSVQFADPPQVGPAFSYEDLARHMQELASKNRLCPSFIGDGLKSYRVPQLCTEVAKIRGLTTAYTPYQPERSQGTLLSLWLYSSALSQLTGFEAINASLYDRSTCLFEAIKTARKIHGKGNKVIICDVIYPGDQEVLLTLQQEVGLELVFVGIDNKTGICNLTSLKQTLLETSGLFAVAYSQVNALGLLEDVDSITDLAQQQGLQTVAIIDPVQLASQGLKPPCEFGQNRNGVDFIVGEGQHLCLSPNFGGPGLGIFGTRFHQHNKTAIRHAPGRLVGAGRDIRGRPCKSIVLSTREQHIRKEKATSNICSNQSFVATLAGAALLAQGDRGLNQSLAVCRQRAQEAVNELTRYQGVKLTYPTAFYNEFVLDLGRDCDEFIESARQGGLHIGVNVSTRVGDGKNHHLMVFCNDLQTKSDYEQLYQFFARQLRVGGSPDRAAEVPHSLLRRSPVALPQYPQQELLDYYQKLGEQNVSPDHAVYPLGSCTMKYNPHLNDYAASLPGFTQVHPQAPLADCQGQLQVLFEIQEAFKAITGLPAVTTQPVAGAQGELVGLKMFQAYHRDRKQKRDLILIPKSAHGTNPATAAMAGLLPLGGASKTGGIILVDAEDDGLIDLKQLQSLVAKYHQRLCGIMITNPNTSGLFEQHFCEVADLLHGVGGLVYMDGANMNAIASWVNLEKLGVDAVHNNLHKTWSIPHGGGGPGDAIVAVSQKLAAYLPGVQIIRNKGVYEAHRPAKSIGQFHRHFGNFAHKVRALTYLKRLGSEGIRHMSAVAVLSSRYLYEHLKTTYSTLPEVAVRPKMHEFILSLSKQELANIESLGIPRSQIIPRIGKLFLDYGLHAPTVAFPEQFGLMVEPTESFSKGELDRFIQVAKSIKKLITRHPEVLQTVPHFTPIDRVDEVHAHRQLQLCGGLQQLPQILSNRIHPQQLGLLDTESIAEKILAAHREVLN